MLDNADELPRIRPFLPERGRGRLLLTTRAEAVGEVAQPVPVTMLTPAASALFLLRRGRLLAPAAPLEAASKDAQRTAVALAQALGGLPLALDQAGAAFLEEAGSTPAEYLALYQDEGVALRARRGDLSTEHASVRVTFTLAFEKVATANPATADLLRLCALLHPEAMPEEVFTAGAAVLGEGLGAAASSPLQWVTTRADACRYSLLAYDRSTKTLGTPPGGASGAAGRHDAGCAAPVG